MHDMSKDARVPPQDEERSRADCYRLLSRLFYAAPDAALLAGIAGSASLAIDNLAAAAPAPAHVNAAGNAYARAFSELQATACGADADALRQEYDDLFVGAGKARTTTYTAGYAVPHAPGGHLLELRQWMAGRGLGRRVGAFEMEDHISAICDIMRWLIERECAIEDQREFFDRFVYTGAIRFCTAVQTASVESFYCAVASLAQAFLAVEKEAFDWYTA
jgi:TorA maturation chaperone TorD